jgi:hypothetical protein
MSSETSLKGGTSSDPSNIINVTVVGSHNISTSAQAKVNQIPVIGNSTSLTIQQTPDSSLNASNHQIQPQAQQPNVIIPNTNTAISTQSFNQTIAFMDQQQHIISENLNSSLSFQKSSSNGAEILSNNSDNITSAVTPTGKKLTKKQLQKLANGESLESILKKTPTQRKLKPKKSSLESSLNESANQQTESSEANGNSTNNQVSATTQSNIDATIDDFMKQYKMKSKKPKEDGADETDSNDSDSSNDNEQEENEESNNKNDPAFCDTNNSFNESDQEMNENDTSKTKRIKNKKISSEKKLGKKVTKKIRDLDSINAENNTSIMTGDEMNNDSVIESVNVKKKRRYNKKKLANIQLEEQSSSGLIDFDTGSNSGTGVKFAAEESLSQAPSGDVTDSALKKSRKRQMNKENNTSSITPMTNLLDGSTPIITPNRSGVGRRKSTANLVKLMSKKARKKRKKTSSGEEDNEDDDSDDFELSCSTAAALSKANAKKEEAAAIADATALAETISQDQNGCNIEGNDEATAKALQAKEKRRSTRATAAKKTKYNDEGLKDEDLLMPPSEADLAAEAAVEAEATNSTLVLQDNFIVDKILGVRMGKRKTKRKVIKDKTIKHQKDLVSNDTKNQHIETNQQETIKNEDEKPIIPNTERKDTINEPENKTDEQNEPIKMDVSITDDVKTEKPVNYIFRITFKINYFINYYLLFLRPKTK